MTRSRGRDAWVPTVLLGLTFAGLMALAGCVVPKPWQPDPPQGHGYSYRFTGVYRSASSVGHDTWRAGKWTWTSHYAAFRRGVSEREDGQARAMQARFQEGAAADARFNAHLGDVGEKLGDTP
jgi:hypothetical protein